MAGYIGTKAVNLSTTGADINGNANIDGTLDVTGNVDLNGGTIDGTVIGGTTPAAVTGTAITGTSFASTGNMTFGDDDKAIFGAGSDLQIYHNGSNSFIDDVGTGNLFVRANNLRLSNADNSQYYLIADNSGFVKLNYAGETKLATTSTGVDVTGTVTADGLTVSGGGSDAIVRIDAEIGDRSDWRLRASDSGSEGELYIEDFSGAAWSPSIKVSHNGDISFYEDTGTTPKFFWDASAESLGIGTATPARPLTVSTTNNVPAEFDHTDGTDVWLKLNNTTQNYYIGYVGTDFVLSPDTSARDLTINSSGWVGIGTTSPLTRLHVKSGIYDTIATFESGDRYGALKLKDSTSTPSTGGVTLGVDGDALYVQTGSVNSNAMRIDSDGNVTMGKTTADNTTEGFTFYGAADGVSIVKASGEPLILNRLTSDGSILAFRKDGTTVGGIGAQTGALVVEGNSTYTGVYFGTVGWLPRKGFANSDNAVDLGALGNRFDDLYATNGTIQTSDRNEKEAIASLTPTEMLVAARLSTSFKNFKWKDAVAEKGLEAARMHSGIIAQDVQDAFAAEGLDASDYAMFISGTWWETQTDVPAVEAVAEVVDEEGNVVTEAVEAKDAYTRTDTYHTLEEAPEGATERTRLGIRYPELLAFVAAYNDQRFLTIEARLTALEATP